MTINYQVLITPLLRKDVYGTVSDITKDVDLSEFIEQGSLSAIKSEIDQGDYDIGVYTFGSITFRVRNFDGRFNEPQIDSRSMFPWYRDRAKVDINFIGDTTKIQFSGLLADKATKQDLSQQSVQFTVLSQDAIFQQIKVAAGTVTNGMTFTEALEAVLDVAEVTAVLGFDIADINPTLNLTIDDGSKFDSLILKAALDNLLFASNSVLVIDSDKNIIVRNRTENSNTPHAFYSGDDQGRDNIYTLTGYNNGIQRMFNSVLINNTESVNQKSIDTYLTRQKSSSLNFITTEATEQAIADSIISTFGYPLTEMLILTDTETAESMNILDKVTVSKDFRITRQPGRHIGLYDVDDYEKAYYGEETGDLKIVPDEIFKIIGFSKNPSTFKTSVKIRSTGVMV